MNWTENQCECSDPGCPAHKGAETCKQHGEAILFRVDMEDESGTLMCDACADDAFASGVFTIRDEEDEEDQ